MQHRFFKPIMGLLVSYSAGAGSMYWLQNANNKRKKTLRLFEPKTLPIDYDYLAPDTSQIRRLQTKKHAEHGDMAHCQLPPQSTSIAIKHKTVEEIWYFSKGAGEMWLKEKNGREYHIHVKAGMALTIAAGTSFQFKNTSETESLEIVITTMPPWPGPEEAVEVEGKWLSSKNQPHFKTP